MTFLRDIPQNFSLVVRNENYQIIQDEKGNLFRSVSPGKTLEGESSIGGWLAVYKAVLVQGIPMSIPGKKPIHNISAYDAEALAQKAGYVLQTDEILSRAFMELVENKYILMKEICEDSTEIGNYANNSKAKKYVLCRSEEEIAVNDEKKWMIGGFNQLGSNFFEWTSTDAKNNWSKEYLKKKKVYQRILRGGSWKNYGDYYPVAGKLYGMPFSVLNGAGLRFMLPKAK